MRLQISIEGYKIQGAILRKGWLCIPPQLLKTANGEVYLNLTAFERKEVGKYGDTHFIKPQFPKEVFEQMSDEQKKNVPICGNVRPLDTPNAQPTPAPTSWDNEAPAESDMPY